MGDTQPDFLLAAIVCEDGDESRRNNRKQRRAGLRRHGLQTLERLGVDNGFDQFTGSGGCRVSAIRQGETFVSHAKIFPPEGNICLLRC